MKIQVLPVQPAVLIQRWADVEPILVKTGPVNLGRYLPIDMLDLCIRNFALAWFVIDEDRLYAVALTRVEQYPRRRGFSVIALAGEQMRDWLGKFDEVLTAYAAQMGCDHFECVGRPGWKRVFGEEPVATVFVKQISPDQNRTMVGGAMA